MYLKILNINQRVIFNKLHGRSQLNFYAFTIFLNKIYFLIVNTISSRFEVKMMGGHSALNKLKDDIES